MLAYSAKFPNTVDKEIFMVVQFSWVIVNHGDYIDEILSAANN